MPGIYSREQKGIKLEKKIIGECTFDDIVAECKQLKNQTRSGKSECNDIDYGQKRLVFFRQIFKFESVLSGGYIWVKYGILIAI